MSFSTTLESFRDFVIREIKPYVRKDRRSQVRFTTALSDFVSEDKVRDLLETYCQKGTESPSDRIGIQIPIRNNVDVSVNYLLNRFVTPEIPPSLIQDTRTYIELLLELM